ncbi:MAG: hypothetical protein N838_12070 [Thiohalocapsa sp. PB-PSB1]|nr:MAG: hypothetical protein N838_09930 [Thiohalocapsa sp. PB-PSB1]QQO53980.1 MAG: hypothetical protein N838_12070 [Thiohalocapsa sp. PB-PSB1]HCS91193.1 hypothetical protein [Chromatiaceae bacterium]
MGRGAFADGAGPRGGLYSTNAVNRLCIDAQRTLAAVDLDVANVVHTSWDSFVQSDALPHAIVGDAPALAYAVAEAPDAALTSTQHIIYDRYPFGNRAFPSILSCKMKSAAFLDALDPLLDSLDPSVGASDQSCAAVHQQLLDEVVASLPRFLRRWVAWQPAPVIEDDDVADDGTAWTQGFPEDPYPVLYREVEDGSIHFKSRRLSIEPHPARVIPFCNSIAAELPPGLSLPAFCEPRKWGVHYCHLATPEYIRAALVGRVEVPIIPRSAARPDTTDSNSRR